MRCRVLLAVMMLTGAPLAQAEETTSPYFGSEDQGTFQLAVNPATGQPLVLKVPATTGVAVAK